MKNEDYYHQESLEDYKEKNLNGYDVYKDDLIQEYEHLKSEWVEENYDTIRYEYEMELIKNGYTPEVAANTNEGRDEFVNKEFNIYLQNKGT